MPPLWRHADEHAGEPMHGMRDRCAGPDDGPIGFTAAETRRLSAYLTVHEPRKPTRREGNLPFKPFSKDGEPTTPTPVQVAQMTRQQRGSLRQRYRKRSLPVPAWLAAPTRQRRATP